MTPLLYFSKPPTVVLVKVWCQWWSICTPPTVLWVQQHCRIYQHNNHENLQPACTYSRDHHENSSTVVRTAMLVMTGKHIARWDKEEWSTASSIIKTGGTGGQHCYFPVVSKFLCSVAHLSTKGGLLSFKACGGSYHDRAFHVSVSASVSISAVRILQ